MRKSYSITELRKRLLIVFISITLFFCLLAGRLFFLQLVQNEELVSRAADQWYRDIPLEAPRGRIYDRNGVVLADNRLVYDVYARPNAVGDRGAAAQALAGVLGYDESRVLERLNMSASEVTIARKVDEEVADRVEALGLSGVYLAAGYEREYPNGSMLSKVIGFTNIDNDGQNGLEGYYDRYLTGVDGYMYGDTDIVGREVGEGGVRYVTSVPGCDVTLTVDAEIQSFAESAAVEAQLEWGAKSCSAIVMDVDTGGIVAMASYPSYDLNDIPRDDIDLLNLLSKNQSLTDVYEPGSTFKIFTTAAALESGVVTDNSRFYCGGSMTVDGRRIRCWRTIGHGSQDLAAGVRNSCNCVFMSLALSMGTDTLYDYLQAFGFGSKTGVDFYGESSGIMMARENVKNVDLARIGFGQAVAVTPLQLATGVCAAVNGGTLYEPHFLTSVTGGTGEIYRHVPVVRGTPISEATSARLRELLVGVVEEGGGSKAAVEGIRVGGKTGTAQKYEDGHIAQGKYVSSFVGFAPADDPEYVVLFIVDEPSGYTYYGSLTAAPYAGRIIDRIADYEGWERTVDPPETYITMPEVTGMSMAEAVAALEAAGLQAETTGEGVVTSTTPAAGLSVAVGDVVLVRGEAFDSS